jgi:hypothetical protein
MCALNISGTHTQTWNATYIHGGTIQALTINTEEIAADAITASKIDVVGIDSNGYIVVTDAASSDALISGINSHAATLIEAGKILISGSTNLGNWSHGSDATKIDGGNIFAESITVNSILAGTITADKLTITNLGTITQQLGNVLAGSITGTTITGGVLRTATSGKRLRLDSNGMRLLYSGGGGLYGTTGNGGSNLVYGTTGAGGSNAIYGSGALASINHPNENVPFYVHSETDYGEFHHPDRSSNPTGAAEIGDTCVIDGTVFVCTAAGTPGTWEPVARYEDRGDPGSWDYTAASFTTDGTWRDLDISGIVGTGLRFVHLMISLVDDAAGSTFSIRENGNSNAYNIGAIATQVANIRIYDSDMWVHTDSSGVIEYKGDNLTFSSIDVLVRGWWVKD